MKIIQIQGDIYFTEKLTAISTVKEQLRVHVDTLMFTYDLKTTEAAELALQKYLDELKKS